MSESTTTTTTGGGESVSLALSMDVWVPVDYARLLARRCRLLQDMVLEGTAGERAHAVHILQGICTDIDEVLQRAQHRLVEIKDRLEGRDV